MNELEIPGFMQPQWFIPLFAAMWLAITGLFGHISGWWSLASKYRASEPPADGDRFRFVSGSIGRFIPVNYGNCLFVTVTPYGFHLSLLFLFRFQSPPLFVPWSDVESVTEKRFLLLFKHTVIEVRGHWSRISFQGRVCEQIQRAFLFRKSL